MIEDDQGIWSLRHCHGNKHIKRLIAPIFDGVLSIMGLKNLSTAVRFSTEMPSKMHIQTKTSLGDMAQYELLCLPIYLIGQLHRLVL